MPRSLVAGALTACLLAFAAAPAQAQTADPCLADHTGDAPVLLRGRVAAERTITATDLRNAATAGTLTAKTVSVTYLQGTTPNKRTYTGVSLYEAMTKLVEPLFGTTIRNIGLRYFLSVTASDSYRVLIAWGDIDPFFGNRGDILLAYDERNDDTNEQGFHSLAGVGPRLIVPNDVRGGRYVSCVRDIRLASTDDSDGVADPAPVPQASPGASGATGATGATGAAGKNGADAGPTCKSSGSTVRCSALLVSSKSKARLTRNGKTVARGTVGRLSASGTLTKGVRYTLRLSSGGSAPVYLA